MARTQRCLTVTNATSRTLVGRNQKLSRFRGQIEPRTSLPRGAAAGRSGEVMAEGC